MSRLKTVGWRVTSCNHDFSLSMRFDSLSHGTTMQAHHTHITCTSHAHHTHITCTSHAHHTRHMHITRTSHAHHITSVSVWHGISSLGCTYVDLRPPSSPSMPPFLVVPTTITDTSLYYIRALHNQQRLPVWTVILTCTTHTHTHTRTHTHTHACTSSVVCLSHRCGAGHTR